MLETSIPSFWQTFFAPFRDKYNDLIKIKFAAENSLHFNTSKIQPCCIGLHGKILKLSEMKDGWLVVLGFNATLTAKVISWRSVTHMFPGYLTPVLTQLFFPKPPTTFLTCFCRGERRKYVGKKSRLHRGSNS